MEGFRQWANRIMSQRRKYFAELLGIQLVGLYGRSTQSRQWRMMGGRHIMLNLL